MQSVAEAFLSALPQSVVQSKLYLMGNDPNGIHVYIDTSLFLVSTVASLFSVLNAVALIAIEHHQYDKLVGLWLDVDQVRLLSAADLGPIRNHSAIMILLQWFQ